MIFVVGVVEVAVVIEVVVEEVVVDAEVVLVLIEVDVEETNITVLGSTELLEGISTEQCEDGIKGSKEHC